MVKHSRNKKSKTRKTYKKMRGGAKYTAAQKQQLLAAGFTLEFIKMAEKNIGFNIMLNDFQQSGLTSEQYMIQTYNDLGIDPDEGMTDSEDSDRDGGKKRRSRKYKGGKRHRKTRKMKGGTCYGNGVGANNYDSNFSVYNTRELQLFPYKPIN